MTEADSDFFFGRARRDGRGDQGARSDTGQASRPARQFRRRQILPCAGRRAGFARAPGLAEHAAECRPLAAGLPRQPPLVLPHGAARRRSRSRRWSSRSCGHGSSTRPIRAGRSAKPNGSKLLLDGKATLRDLLDATERRYDELHSQAAGLLPLYRSGRGALRALPRSASAAASRSSGAAARRPAPARAHEIAFRLPRRICRTTSRSTMRARARSTCRRCARRSCARS